MATVLNSSKLGYSYVRKNWRKPLNEYDPEGETLKAKELKRYDAYPLLVQRLQRLGELLDLYGQHGDMVSAYSGSVAMDLKATNALLKKLGEKPIKLTGVDLSDPDLEFRWETDYLSTVIKR